MTSQKNFISTTAMPKDTKVSSMVTFFEELVTVKSYDHLNMWLYKVRGQLKNISNLLQSIFSPNF